MKAWTLALSVLLAPALYGDMAAAQAAYQRGAALEKQKLYSQAISEYEAALEAEPRYIYAHKQIGTCNYYLGDKDAALHHYEAYLAAKPDDAQIRKFAESLRAGGAKPSAGGAARGSDYRKNIIYTNPVSFAFATYNLGYERSIFKNMSLHAEGAYSSLGYGTFTYTMMGGGLGARISTKPLHGWFVGPKVQYFTVSAIEKVGTVTATATGTAFGVGGEGGIAWQWDNGFHLALGLGVQQVSINVGARATSSSSSATASASANFSGMLPSGILNMGFAF